MSADHVSALAAAISADPELAARFSAVGSVGEAVALATELGFQLSGADLVEVAELVGGPEIPDAELGLISAAGSGRPYGEENFNFPSHLA